MNINFQEKYLKKKFLYFKRVKSLQLKKKKTNHEN